MNGTKVVRQSNIELLRIVSMFLIVIFHCAYKSDFEFESYLSINKFIVKFFWMFGELGVNLFVLISGYFMIKGKFKWKKVLFLWAEIMFYQLFTHFLAYKIGIFTMSGGGIIKTFFPVILNEYWFMTVYLIIYIMSPYFNIFANAMSKSDYKYFLVTVLFFYSVIPTICGAFYNTTETMLYYNRLIWCVIMYFLGAYIRLYSHPILETPKRSMILSGVSLVILIMSILIIARFDTFFAILGIEEVAYLWSPNTVPMLFLSLGVLGVFLNMKIIYNSLINKIASMTLGVYLLHDGILAPWIWNEIVRCADYYRSSYLIFYMLGSGVIIFLIGITIDLIRQLTEKCIEKFFNRWFKRQMGKA